MNNRYHYAAKLLRLIDADTYELDIDLGFHIHAQHRIRLAGVDCPERGTARGWQTTVKAAQWWSNHEGHAQIHVIAYDRYGRIVAEIHPPQQPGNEAPDLAAWLLGRGCKPYKGK